MREFVVGLAITVMLPLVVLYGVISFSPAAGFRDLKEADFLKSHEEILLQKRPITKGKAAPKVTPEEEEGFKKEFKAGVKEFNKHLFYVAAPTGILAIAIGLILPIPGIASGMMCSGLLTLVYGYCTYWKDLPIRIRFVSLLGGLILFVIIGWFKLPTRRKPT